MFIKFSRFFPLIILKALKMHYDNNLPLPLSFLHLYEPKHNLSQVCNLSCQSVSHRLYWLSTFSKPDNIKDHTPTQKNNSWYAFFFEYNVRKSVCHKCAVLLRHVMNCSRIGTNYIHINRNSCLSFSSDCSPIITQTLSCLHCLQVSMWGNQHVGFCGGECHSNP